MNYNIRLAHKKDAKNLAILKQRVWDETYRGIYDDEIIDNFDYSKSEKSLKDIIDNKNMSLYVVESNNELVGYMCVGKPKREFSDYNQEVSLLYLRKDFQKLGIGTKLFHLAYNEIKKNGYDKFFISCNKYNTNARIFYENMGGQLIYEDEEIGNKRFIQAKYHFTIEPKSDEKTNKVGEIMDYNTLKNILLQDKPSKLIKEQESEIFAFIPELKKSKDFNQHNIWHVYDVYEHILHVIDGVPANLISRLTALFHDIGKPSAYTQDENGVGHFYGHWDISKDIFLEFAKENNLDESTTENVSKLIEYHDIRVEQMSDEELKNIISNFTEEDIDLLFAQKRSDLLAQNSIYHHLLESYEEQRKRVLNIYKTLHKD